MRLSPQEINNLKTSALSNDADAKLYLFGSRVDDSKKGGDIDLLIISDKISRKDVRTIRLNFFEQFGEQKLDIVVDDGKLNTPFVKMIFNKAILLSEKWEVRSEKWTQWN